MKLPSSSTAGARDRVLTLLLLESAEPRSWDRSWQDEDAEGCADRFASSGSSNSMSAACTTTLPANDVLTMQQREVQRCWAAACCACSEYGS